MILGSLMESATVGRDRAASSAASGDRILVPSAKVARDITASSAEIAALLSRGEPRSRAVAAAKE
jgi:hypothetical protein